MRRAVRDGWQTLRDRWQIVIGTGVASALIVGAVAVGWREMLSGLDLVAGVLALLLVLKAVEIFVVFGSRLVR